MAGKLVCIQFIKHEATTVLKYFECIEFPSTSLSLDIADLLVCFVLCPPLPPYFPASLAFTCQRKMPTKKILSSPSLWLVWPPVTLSPK